MNLIEEINNWMSLPKANFFYLLFIFSLIVNIKFKKIIFREEVVLHPSKALIFIVGKISKKLEKRIFNYSRKVKDKKENILNASYTVSVLIVFLSYFMTYYLLTILFNKNFFNTFGNLITPIAMLLPLLLLSIIFKWFYQRIYLKHIKKHIYNHGKEIIDEIPLDK